LRFADAIVAGHAVEADAYRQLGLPPQRVHVLPPAVELPPDEPPPLGVSLPPGARLVLGVGSLTPAHGFRDAVWAADILRYVVPGSHLVIVGDGPDRTRLRRFVQGIHGDSAERFIHRTPPRPDAAALLARADVVWVPSRSECGRQVLLEAMAAGRPVVASALPGLAAWVVDGVTGLLAPPGDPAGLARQTRRLLEDPDLARQLGAAARQAMVGHVPEQVAPTHAGLYEAASRH
jgi:glycosyltransferase involved in cell wall biosynthesis